jgi:lipoprotein
LRKYARYTGLICISFRTTNCGLSVIGCSTLRIIAVLPYELPVLTITISLGATFISGDSSYFSQLIYVHLDKSITPSTIFEGLNEIAPFEGDNTKSSVV